MAHVKVVAIDVEGLRFNSQAGQIGHSVANGSLPLRRFFGAALSRVKPRGQAPPLATTLQYYSEFNETSAVKI